MNFCECGAILVPSKDDQGNVILVCHSCGAKILLNANNSAKFEDKQKITHKESEKTVIIENDRSLETMPTAKVICEKCGHNEAVYWLLQTRSGDEATTTFYRCKKCKHTWRDYG